MSKLPCPKSSALPEISRYEQACDQAIAMCDGNLRSTIKALIMANEYLEAELEELQAAVAAGCAPADRRARAATPPDRHDPIRSNLGSNTMADVTYYVALPFLQDEGGSPVAGAPRNARVRPRRCGAPNFVAGRGLHRRGRVQPHRRSHDRRIRRRARC